MCTCALALAAFSSSQTHEKQQKWPRVGSRLLFTHRHVAFTPLDSARGGGNSLRRRFLRPTSASVAAARHGRFFRAEAAAPYALGQRLARREVFPPQLPAAMCCGSLARAASALTGARPVVGALACRCTVVPSPPIARLGVTLLIGPLLPPTPAQQLW